MRNQAFVLLHIFLHVFSVQSGYNGPGFDLFGNDGYFKKSDLVGMIRVNDRDQYLDIRDQAQRESKWVFCEIFHKSCPDCEVVEKGINEHAKKLWNYVMFMRVDVDALPDYDQTSHRDGWGPLFQIFDPNGDLKVEYSSKNIEEIKACLERIRDGWQCGMDSAFRETDVWEQYPNTYKFREGEAMLLQHEAGTIPASTKASNMDGPGAKLVMQLLQMRANNATQT